MCRRESPLPRPIPFRRDAGGDRGRAWPKRCTSDGTRVECDVGARLEVAVVGKEARPGDKIRDGEAEELLLGLLPVEQIHELRHDHQHVLDDAETFGEGIDLTLHVFSQS